MGKEFVTVGFDERNGIDGAVVSVLVGVAEGVVDATGRSLLVGGKLLGVLVEMELGRLLTGGKDSALGIGVG